MKYLRYLWLIFNMSYQTAAAYRVDFILRIIRSFLEVGSSLLVVTVYFNQSTSIAGWSQDQVLLVLSIALFIGSLVMFLWGNGLENLHQEIVNGSLDRMLLQPMDDQWLASTRIMYITNLFRIIFNFALLTYIINRLHIHLSSISLILLLSNLLSSLIIYYSIMFTAAAIAFWSFSGELFYLFNSITSTIRYPLDIFHRGIKLILTIFPLIFIATVPATIILGRTTILAYLSPFIAVISFIIARSLWRLGLKHYESASS